MSYNHTWHLKLNLSAEDRARITILAVQWRVSRTKAAHRIITEAIADVVVPEGLLEPEDDDPPLDIE